MPSFVRQTAWPNLPGVMPRQSSFPPTKAPPKNSWSGDMSRPSHGLLSATRAHRSFAQPYRFPNSSPPETQHATHETPMTLVERVSSEAFGKLQQVVTPRAPSAQLDFADPIAASNFKRKLHLPRIRRFRTDASQRSALSDCLRNFELGELCKPFSRTALASLDRPSCTYASASSLTAKT